MSEVDTKPPKKVAEEAELGLKLRGLFNRGGTEVGVARARDLKNRKNVSEDTIKRMVSFFARHGAQIDRRDEGWENRDNPSAEWIAWLLWGGDSGKNWSERKKEEFKMKDVKKSYLEDTLKSAKTSLKPWEYASIKNLYNKYNKIIKTIQESKKKYKKEYHEESHHESGIHIHLLDRGDLSTKYDGNHRHMFLISGYEILTDHDGSHSHKLEFEDSNSISGGGEHNHSLILPKGLKLPSGRVLEEDMKVLTDYSGKHSHELQVHQTAIDGYHQHSIKIDGEDTIYSISPGEYWKRIKNSDGDKKDELSKSQPSAGDVHVESAGNSKKPRKKKKKLKPGEVEELKPQKLSNSIIKSTGNPGCDYMFVIDSPNNKDIINKSITIDDDFEEIYIKPLGITKSDAAFSLAVPVPVLSKNGRPKPPSLDEINKWNDLLLKEIDRINPKVLIAVGRLSRLALKGVEDITLPNHKIARIHKKQDDINNYLLKLPKLIHKRLKIKRKAGKILKDDEINKEKELNINKNDSFNVNIIKSDDDKRIVYSVVLDPYQVDAHNDWIPPSEIEKTAHNWFKESRLISLNHAGPSESKAVESFLVEYPTKEDYKKAMSSKPHSAYARKFGNDVVYSGSWILGTELSEEDYKLFKSGELNSYSIEGFGVKRKSDKKEMPRVNFIWVSE